MMLHLGFLIVSGLLHNFALCDEVNNVTTVLPTDSATTPAQTTVPVPTPTPPSTNIETTVTTPGVQINSLNLFSSEVNKYIFSSDEKDSPASVIWSPLSVYTTLRTLYEGANGTTLEEMKNVLHINDNELAANFSLISPNSLLKSFTGLFVADGVTLNPTYEERVASSSSNKDLGMTTKIQSVDFKLNLLKSAQYINEIIENKTAGHIRKIIDPASLSTTTKMVIVNAVLFKAKWRNPFDIKNTKSDTFHGLKSATTVNMMRQKGTFDFQEIKELNASVLQMDYTDSSFVCQIILPDLGTSIQSVWKAVNEKGVIDELSNDMQPTEMEVFIPTVYIESELPVQEPLVKMGLSTLFVPQADLSRMLLPTKDSRNEVYVNKIVHKTVFQMDEHGTKAAAATAAVLIPLSNFNSQPQAFRADRPFIFLLKDVVTNSIAFMGCVTELPSAETADLSDSNRANLIPPPPEKQDEVKDSSAKNSAEDESPDFKKSTASSPTTEEEWWKHSGPPEYLTENSIVPSTENSVAPLTENPIVPSTESSIIPTTKSTENATLITPRFQEPLSKNPTSIIFPYPYTAEYKLYGSALKKSKEKNKPQSS